MQDIFSFLFFFWWTIDIKESIVRADAQDCPSQKVLSTELRSSSRFWHMKCQRMQTVWVPKAEAKNRPAVSVSAVIETAQINECDISQVPGAPMREKKACHMWDMRNQWISEQPCHTVTSSTASRVTLYATGTWFFVKHTRTRSKYTFKKTKTNTVP